jgi:hypothetical protein
VTEVVKEIAQCWGVLSKEDKQKYKDQARKGRILSFFYIHSNYNNIFLDKERYEKELRSLESYSEKLRKPKKCLSAYMIFVKEVSPYHYLILQFHNAYKYSCFKEYKTFSIIKLDFNFHI